MFDWRQISMGIIVGGLVLALICGCAIMALALLPDFMAGFMAGLQGH